MKKNKLIFLSVFALSFLMFLGSVDASCCYKNNGVYVYDATMSGSVCLNKSGDPNANESTCKAKNPDVCCDTKTGTLKNGLTDTECASNGYKKVAYGTCAKEISTPVNTCNEVTERECVDNLHGTYDKNTNCCNYTVTTNIDTSENNAANIQNPNNPNNPNNQNNQQVQERTGTDQDYNNGGKPTDPFPDSKIDLGCDGMKDILGLIKTIYNLIRYATPLVLIILGSVDFMKAVMAGKEDDIKKNQHRFVSRLILAVGVFLLLSVFQLITNILSSAGTEDSDAWYNCWNSLMIMFK